MVTEGEKTLIVYLYPKVSLPPKSSLLNSSLFLYLKPLNIFSTTFRKSLIFFPETSKNLCVPRSVYPSISLFCYFPSCSVSCKFTDFFLTSISLHVLFPPPRKFSAHINRCSYKSNLCLNFKWLMITLPKVSPKKMLSGKLGFLFRFSQGILNVMANS